MKLTNTINLEFNNGYFEVQHEKVSKETGKVYLSDKKTFATLSHLRKYLTPYSTCKHALKNGVKLAKLEAGIKSAKQGKVAAERFGK